MISLAMVPSFGLGAATVQGLHAQANPPVYSVAEIEIADQAAYSTYVPKAQAAIKAAGGKFLAAGGTITAVEGEPPKPRVVIQ
jgi:tRNA A37 threonylcarbamoyladenosine modification protein TsaB